MSKIGLWLKFVPGNTNKKEFLYKLINIRMEGLWKISIGYHNRDNKSEKFNVNNWSPGWCGVFCYLIYVVWMFWNIYFNTKLTINKNKNSCDVKLNDINYNRKVRKLHDNGWKTSFSLVLMFLCFVMDVVFCSIINFIIKI